MGIVSQKLRDSARGQRCTFELPGVCNHDPETTVLCHAPSEVKGMGNKGDDFHAAFGCYDCHTHIDQRTASAVFHEHSYWLRAIQRTQRIWFEMGLLQVPVTEKRRETSSKILPRRDMRKSA